MPDSHAQTSDGLLLIANGIDEVLVWDGLGDVQVAGVKAPLTALLLGGSGSGSGTLSGTYYAYTRFLDERGNPSNLSPLAGPVTLANEAQVLYASVPRPTQQKVVKRQILRNTNGQAGVFYVDIETTNLTRTSFTSTRSDSELAAQEAVTLLDSQFNLLANSYSPPPAHKSVIAHHLDRMFMTGEIEYREGSVSVTLGSRTVRGVGTEWPSTFEGRFLYVDGAPESYQIQGVTPGIPQTLTLLKAYAGASNPYSLYAIRPAPAERRLVYYSLPGRPEAWPLTQALSLQEDGDEITGLMPKGSFVYFLEKRHIYRFTYQDDPATDGFVFLSAGRGCVNNRSWVVVEDKAYMLDEAGIHAFSGGQEVEELSGSIQDLFEPEGESDEYRINWSARANFHASYHPGQNVIRWFVSLSGHDFPRHALCLERSGNRWWIEEYPVPIGASCLGRFGNQPRVCLGGPSGQVYLFGEGTLDRARSPGADTLRGMVTSASWTTLSDALASWTQASVSTPVCIVSGRGRGQRRVIAGVAGTTVTLSQPWLTLPDTSSVYQVGGVQWRWRSKIWRYKDDDREQARRIEILFEPCESETQVEAQLYQDRSKNPVVWASTVGASEYGGFASAQGESVLLGDLTRKIGYLSRRLDGQKDLYADGPRFLQVKLSGVTNRDQVRIYQMVVEGVR